MRNKIMFSYSIPQICAIAIATILYSIDLTDANAAQIDDYRVQIIADDTKRDGPVDRKLHLRITNHVSRSSVDLACHHWTLGHNDWTLKFVTIDVGVQPRELQSEAMAQAVADAARIAENMLTKDYSTNLVSTVQLLEEGMPKFFTQSIYQSLASEMRRSDARSEAAKDRRLRQMLQTVFNENKTIQLIAKRLEDRGFALAHAEPQELISVRPELAGMTWQKISTESAAGLKNDSTTVTFYDLSSKGNN